MNYITLVTIILVIMWSIAFLFVNIFECGKNLSVNWAPVIVLLTSKCVNVGQFNEAFGITDFLMDFIIFFMPIPSVWKLQMPLGGRLAVIGILALGALAVVASLIRMVIVILIVDDFTNSFLSEDPDIIVSMYIYWSLLESGLATIVACLPSMRSLTRKIPDILRSLGSMFSLTSNATSASRSRRNFRNFDNNSGSSEAGIAKISNLKPGMGTETYAMNDIEAAKPYSSEGITVQNEVTLENSYNSAGRFN